MKRAILAIMLSTAALSAQASGTDYNYVQASYGSAELEGIDFSGFDINGSYKFNENFYGIAGYQSFDESSVGLSEFFVGAGFRKVLLVNTDWIAEVSYVNNSVDLGPYGDVSDNGYRVATGLRAMILDNLELSMKINYSDLSDLGKGMGGNIDGLYRFTENFGVTAGWDYIDRDSSHYSTWNVGVRYSF